MCRRMTKGLFVVMLLMLCLVATGGSAFALPATDPEPLALEASTKGDSQDALVVLEGQDDAPGLADALEFTEEDSGVEVLVSDADANEASAQQEKNADMGGEALAAQSDAEVASPVGLSSSASKQEASKNAALSARAHVQKVGWQSVRSGHMVTLGTTGKGLRMEAIAIDRPSADLTGSVVYRAHVQGIGWQDAVKDGAVAGTTGRGLRVEALRIKLTGQLGRAYDVWYRLHVQKLGWLAWAHNGESSGTQGLALRAEAVQIALVPTGKGSPGPQNQNVNRAFVKSFKASYRVMAGGAWCAWKASGSAGKGSGPTVNAVCASLPTSAPAAIEYAAHLSGTGWTNYVGGGVPIGSERTTMEAVRIRLSGVGALVESVWYRVHVRGVGWTQWAHDGGIAGSVGKGWPITALQVKVLPKTAAAPVDDKAAIPYECLDANSPQMLKNANARQKRLLNAANTTAWPGASLCAAWVQNVYDNAGYGHVWGNANDLYYSYCTSSNIRDLKVGMIVAVSTHTQSEAGRQWGHVGIYVGNGWVMHSTIYGVSKVSLSYWLNRYGTTVSPRWGWLGNAHVA